MSGFEENWHYTYLIGRQMCLHNILCRKYCLDMMFPYVFSIPEYCVTTSFMWFLTFLCTNEGLKKFKR